MNQPLQPSQDDWKLYELLFDEVRHYHEVWRDNLRLLLTFNSIFLPASCLVLAYLFRTDTTVSTVTNDFISLKILITGLSVIGIVVTTTYGLLIVSLKHINRLRQDEIFTLEKRMAHLLALYPYHEGRYLLDSAWEPDLLDEEAKNRILDRGKRGKINFHTGVLLISTAFIIAYVGLTLLAWGDISVR